MSDQIKSIAAEFAHKQGYLHFWNEEVIEKFAEHMVRKCAQWMADGNIPDGFYEADRLLEYFGVGEQNTDHNTANYIDPVKFTNFNHCGSVPDDEDDVYTVEEFRKAVKSGALIDYDGHGHPVRDKLADPDVIIQPSCIEQIPKDATHIVWYNR